MQDGAVIRLLQGQLAWYPPGAGDVPHRLDAEAEREQLLLALSQSGSTVYFAAPGVDVRLCQFDVSAQEKKHIEKSLPFMLEESLVSDIEDLHFASGMQGKTRMKVAICARRKMQAWQALLAEFPGVKQWIPEPLLLPWKKGEWCIVVENNMAVVRTASFDGFAIESQLLRSALEAALKDTADPPQAVVIYGQNQVEDTALVPDEIQALVQWRRGGMGAALMLAEAPDSSFNLLQGDFGARLPLGRWWKQWRAVAAVISVAFLLQLVATYAEFSRLEEENIQLRSAVEQSYRKAYPRGAIVDPEKQLKRQLGAMRGSTQSSGFVSLMNGLGGVIHANPGASIGTVNYNDKSDEIRMNITAGDFEAVESIRTALNDAGLNATMESSNAQGNKVRARMRVARGS